MWKRIARSTPSSDTSERTDLGFSATGITVRFGSLTALEDVDFVLNAGEILGVIGPNGAGKTTLTNVLTGFQVPTAGSVRLDGHDVTRWRPQELCRNGVVRTFQSVRPFGGLTVRENLAAPSSISASSARARTDLVQRLLERFELEPYADVLAKNLSHGTERRLGVARALAGRPRYLLLDEPAAGLNEIESQRLVDVLRAVHVEFECALMVIEHDMRVIMQLCDRIQVLDSGRTIAVGTPDVVRSSPAVLEAYLGANSGGA